MVSDGKSDKAAEKSTKSNKKLTGSNAQKKSKHDVRLKTPTARPNLRTKPLSAWQTNQKKKKKKTQIQEAAENVTRSQEQRKEAALQYLKDWNLRTEGGVWKFQKNKQSWLLKNIYEPKLVPKKYFGCLVKYMKGLPEAKRTQVLEKAQGIYKNCETELEKTDKDSIPKETAVKFERSRILIEKLLI